jgi:hypothetical protein
VSVDLAFQAEVPALAGVKTCLQAGVSVPAGTLRVDTSVVDGDLTSPMCLVVSAGPAFRSANMAGFVDVVEAHLLVTCIGTSVELVTQLRARAARALVGWNRATKQRYVPLTVVGMVVVARRLTDERLPAVSSGGGWVNAVLPVTLTLQPAS